MSDFYERMRASYQESPGGQSSLDIKPKGTLFKMLDYLDRPRMTLSEAIQAVGAGEDVGEAAWRGLKGQPKFGTLGEAAFPEAAEPGFQPEDIPAFAIDVLTDPTTWIGPGAIKAAGRPVAKGLLKLGAKAIPQETKILSGLTSAARMLPRAEKAKMLAGELEQVGLTAEEAFDRVWKLTDKVSREKLGGLSKIKNIDELPEEGLSVLQEGIRDLQANIRPDEATSLNSLVQAAANRWLPAG